MSEVLFERNERMGQIGMLCEAIDKLNALKIVMEADRMVAAEDWHKMVRRLDELIEENKRLTQEVERLENYIGNHMR